MCSSESTGQACGGPIWGSKQGPTYMEPPPNSLSQAPGDPILGFCPRQGRWGLGLRSHDLL